MSREVVGYSEPRGYRPRLSSTKWYDRNGTVAGTSDWAWREYGLLGEFDGRIKYGRLLKPGESPGDAVFREKRREDELREMTGWPMFRLIWSDYDHPVATADRIRRLLHRAA